MAIRIVCALAILVASGTEAQGGVPPKELVEKMTGVIHEHCPEATIEVTENDGFVAKHETMQFTVHGMLRSGEISSKTHQEEGPNYKGFLLRIDVRPEKYAGAAVVPQTLKRPYFPMYIDGPPTESGDSHYWVRFAYGSRLDEKLKKAIFEAIPKTKFEGEKPTDAPVPPPAKGAGASTGTK